MKPLLLTLLLTALLAPSASTMLSAKKPNILFIITDQHHANMLSSAGNPYLKTRALDSMAKSGIRFANAYVTYPVCVPSRISIATGMMPGRFGVFSNGMKATKTKEVSDNSLGKLIKSGRYDDLLRMARSTWPLSSFRSRQVTTNFAGISATSCPRSALNS